MERSLASTNSAAYFWELLKSVPFLSLWGELPTLSCVSFAARMTEFKK